MAFEKTCGQATQTAQSLLVESNFFKKTSATISKNKKLLGFGAVFVIVVFCAYLFYRENSRLRSDLSELEEELTTEKAENARLRTKNIGLKATVVPIVKTVDPQI